jgi:hypothetical protein
VRLHFLVALDTRPLATGNASSDGNLSKELDGDNELVDRDFFLIAVGAVAFLFTFPDDVGLLRGAATGFRPGRWSLQLDQHSLSRSTYEVDTWRSSATSSMTELTSSISCGADS